MYLPDLSPHHEYHKLGTLAVGWLKQSHPYTQGETSEEFRGRLFEFCLNPILETRGFHTCEFCIDLKHTPIKEQRNQQEVWLGSAELRVIYGDKIYAAPNLIYHYVIVHNYMPPDEFVEAVIKGLSPTSPEYQALNTQYWSL